MHWGLVKTIILLPGTVLVLILGIILLTTRNSIFAPEFVSPAQIWFWMALLSASVGLVLSVWTVRLFMKVGGGTPAPFGTPRKGWLSEDLTAMLEIR